MLALLLLAALCVDISSASSLRHTSATSKRILEVPTSAPTFAVPIAFGIPTSSVGFPTSVPVLIGTQPSTTFPILIAAAPTTVPVLIAVQPSTTFPILIAPAPTTLPKLIATSPTTVPVLIAA